MITTYIDSLNHRYTDTTEGGKLVQRVIGKPDSIESYTRLNGDRWIYETTRYNGDRLRSRSREVVDCMPENPSQPIRAIAQ